MASSSPAASGATRPTPGQVAPVSIASGSAWDRPALNDPTTVTISEGNWNIVLDQTMDYILQCPPGANDMTGGPVIWGGHDVVLENCDINVTQAGGGMSLKNQTGTVWIHDLHISGTHLTQGINLQEPGATVVMRDVLIDTVHGSYTTNHAELIQTWAGPARLLIDGLTGSTTYQGFFLLPNQWYSGPPPTQFDFRNVNIDDSQGAYALWLDDVNGGVNAMQLNLQNVYVEPQATRTDRSWWLWPKPTSGDMSWANVVAGSPQGGSYVQATDGGATGVDELISPTPLADEET
jgi:hypothetical protein